MTERRDIPTTHISGLAKLIAGDNSCLFSTWFKSWHHGYRRAWEDRSGLAEWNASHAHVVRESADRLEQRGDSVFLEMQNWFETTSSRSRSRIVSKPAWKPLFSREVANLPQVPRAGLTRRAQGLADEQHVGW